MNHREKDGTAQRMPLPNMQELCPRLCPNPSSKPSGPQTACFHLWDCISSLTTRSSQKFPSYMHTQARNMYHTLCVCVPVCVYTCICVCMCVYLSVYVCSCMYVCVHSIRAHVCAGMSGGLRRECCMFSYFSGHLVSH